MTQLNCGFTCSFASLTSAPPFPARKEREGKTLAWMAGRGHWAGPLLPSEAGGLYKRIPGELLYGLAIMQPPLGRMAVAQGMGVQHGGSGE